jgi:hypothetical protein
MHRRNPNRSGRRIALGLIAVAAACPVFAEGLPFQCTAEGSPVECRVCLVPFDYSKELTCSSNGRFLDVPDGRYELRVFAKSLALPTNTTLSFSPEEFEPTRRLSLSLISGGVVDIPTAIAAAGGAVHLLSLKTGRVDTVFVDRERQIPFPAGDVIAIALSAPNKFLGMTTPWRLNPGATKKVPELDAPKPGRGHLLARIDYPSYAPEMLREVEVSLEGERPTASIVSLPSATLYSAFYNAPSGRRKLDVKSRFWRMEDALVTIARPMSLEKKGVLPKPSLRLKIEGDLPPDAVVKTTLYDCDQTKEGAGQPVWPELSDCSIHWRGEAKARKLEIPHLDPRWYFATAEWDGHSIGRRVDLRPAVDVSETFEFRRTRVEGRVRLGGVGVSATLQWADDRSGKIETTVEADVEGFYEAAVWSPKVALVTVSPSRRPEIADRQWIDIPAISELRRDFDIPDTDVRVLVKDSRTEKLVADAKISFVQSGASAEASMQEGEVRLSGIAPGKLRCHVSADGYVPSDIDLQVSSTSKPQTFSVRLDPLGEEKFLALLPTGIPAAHADIMPGVGPVSYSRRVQCDANGECRLPAGSSREEPLLVFHPAAGLTVTTVGSVKDEGRLLLRRSGGPLTVGLQRGAVASLVTLQVSVAVDGLLIDPMILGLMANRLQKSYRIYLQPGFAGPFEVQGLPEGELIVAVGPVGQHRSDLAPTTLRMRLPSGTAPDLALP